MSLLTSVYRERNRERLQETREWRPLAYLGLYRIVLSAMFVVLYWSGPSPHILGSHNGRLFLGTAVFYFLFSLYSLFTIRRRTLGFTLQAVLQAIVDILALTLMMHSSGGVTSGLGILIVIAIAGSSIILAGRMAILLAAVGSISILVEQVYAHLNDSFETTAYTQTGILGATFFATALLSHVFANRLRESEELARQRSIDLADLEQLNEYIIQNMEAGILVVDNQFQVRLVNESAWYLLGMPALQEDISLRRLSPELADQLRQWRDNPEYEIQPFRPHSESADILPKFTPLGRSHKFASLIQLEDSTQVTQQLQQMKLASLGRLTASIAHEIRNPLGAISHAAQLLRESPELDPTDERLANIIQEQSRRMNTIVENILQLSRREQSHPKVIELQAWVRDFVDEFCHQENLRPRQVAVDVYPENTMIQMDTTHLQQVLWNLCKNALQYGHREGQETRIVLRGGITEESKGPFLDIIDFGEGIDPATAAQIFEPFFTTSHQGTGLGLYLTKELCECNKARLSYHAVPTGGSCFRISFYDPRRTRL